MITTIESAIVETIRAARLPYLRYLGTYGGELDGDPQSIIRQAPTNPRPSRATLAAHGGRSRRRFPYWSPPAASKTKRPPATATPCMWAATR